MKPYGELDFAVQFLSIAEEATKGCVSCPTITLQMKNITTKTKQFCKVSKDF